MGKPLAYSICCPEMIQTSRFSTNIKVLYIIAIWHRHEIYFSVDLTAVIGKATGVLNLLS